MGYIFVCGSQNEAWACNCLDSWRPSGTCLLDYLITPFSVHNVSETAHWASFLMLFTRIADDLPGGIPDGDGYVFAYILSPWLCLAAHQYVVSALAGVA